MGILCDYFAANGDDDAAKTIDWVGGPSRPPAAAGLLRKRRTDPYPTVQAPGIEPAVMMTTLEGLLTGRSLDDVDDIIGDNARRHIAASHDGGCMVLRLSTTLADALAESDEARLTSVAQPWSQTEEFFGQGDPDVLAGVLVDLSALARQARRRGENLYCWMCV
jgi:hypothetical protein